MKTLLWIITGIIAVALGTFFIGIESVAKVPSATAAMPASIFLVQSTTPKTLQQIFNESLTTGRKIKILIVPGHEPDFGGAEYKNIKERDMAVDLANNLYEYLSKNPHYNVALTRNKEGWNPDLATYFTNNSRSIRQFIQDQKSEMSRLVALGHVNMVDNNIYHNDAPDEVAVRLYGINKWANEQHVDIVLHIHFNDSASRRNNKPDTYTGFSIYVPEKQYSNAVASSVIAQNIFARLGRFFASSNLPYEDRGIVEEQNLIAVGSNNTVDAASMLIEYGYIYEPQFAHPETRTTILREFAFQTYLGISDFFGEPIDPSNMYRSTVLPYTWSQPLSKSTTPHPEILAAQAALTLEGLYPPQGTTKNDCPVSGVFGACTERALKEFQTRFHIRGNGSILSSETQAKLNELYGHRIQ